MKPESINFKRKKIMNRAMFFIVVALTMVCSLSAQKVNVAAAANLRFVLEEIKDEYQKLNPNSKVNITFGSSGNLVQQIINGAAFDFFMAADNNFPLKLKEKGVTYGEMRTYAFGKLAIYSTTLDLTSGIDILNNPLIKKISIAKPETAPYGDRSIALLKSQNLYDGLKPKIVLADNISQAAQFAYTGNAEVGFVALSLALSPDMLEKGTYHIVDQALYTPIEQACILIKQSVANGEAKKFMSYVLSPATIDIWEKYGYASPAKDLLVNN